MDDVYFHARAMAYLATGASAAPGSYPLDPNAVTVIRPAEPAYSAFYTNPGHADPGADPASTADDAFVATGDPDFVAVATPSNPSGDDYCGLMTMAAMDAVFFVVRELVEAVERGSSISGRSHRQQRTILCSFSNGLTCASRWMATSIITNHLHGIHALIDLEGPTDSLEQTVTTDCFDPFGGTTLPGAIDYATWSGCGSTVHCGHTRPNQYFDDAWGYFMRPPQDILFDFGAQASVQGPYSSAWGSACNHARTSTYKQWYGSGYVPGAPTAAASTARSMRDFWRDREAKEHLEDRMGGYVRINRLGDHAQPSHMKNRDAVNALNAAFNGVVGDTWYADISYLTALGLGDFNATPTAMTTSYDATNPTGSPSWPVWEDFGLHGVDRWHVEVDLIRWAARQEF